MFKYCQAITLATALAAGSLATADEAALNEFVVVPPSQGPSAIGAGVCYDYYPLFLGGFAGYESLLALSCVQDANCVFDIFVIPAGSTTLLGSFNNIWAGRELKFLSAAAGGGGQLAPLRGTYGQIFIFDGSAAGTTIGASRHYLFSGGNPFSVEMPESNCSF